MVRQLTLNFLYSGPSGPNKPESEELSLVMAFALAVSKGGKKKLSMLSPIAIPYWIVQISDTKSILLRTDGGGGNDFTFTENKSLGEIRRIIGSEVNEAGDIPKVADKIIKHLQATSDISIRIAPIEQTGPIKSAGRMIVGTDPNARPNRLDMFLDSHGALSRSEEFQRLREGARLRANALEEIQSYVEEVLHGHLSAFENVTIAEKERWNQRMAQMESRFSDETASIAKKRDDKIYEFKDRHKRALRALTADFSRSLTNLEGFFNSIVLSIQEARSLIAGRGENVDGARMTYEEAMAKISDQVAKYDAQLKSTDTQMNQLQAKRSELDKNLETQIAGANAEFESQVAGQKKRLEDLKAEAEQKKRDLDATKTSIEDSVEKIQNAARERITALQSEFLKLLAWTLENTDLDQLAPLTQLDVHCYFAFYEDKTLEVLTPGYIPSESFSIPVAHKPIDSELHGHISQPVVMQFGSNERYAEMIRKCGSRDNKLLDSHAKNLLVEGLEIMQRRSLLNEGVKETLIASWGQLSGKCPKCGSATGVDDRFCPKCGFDVRPID